MVSSVHPSIHASALHDYLDDEVDPLIQHGIILLETIGVLWMDELIDM